MSVPSPTKPAETHPLGEEAPSRPTTGTRPKTAKTRRTGTARPDTSASGIGPLPDQEFYAEDSEGEEDEEEVESEPEPEVFAFHRPQTAAVPVVAFSEGGSSAPPTGDGTGPAPTTAETHHTHGTFGTLLSSVATSPEIEPTGSMDAGGRVPYAEYNSAKPPPFSGRHNPNNSAFAFSISSRGTKSNNSISAPRSRPSTQRSLLDRLHRRNINTASTNATGMTGMTDMTGTSHFTTTDDGTRESLESATGSEAGSYTESNVSQHHRARKVQSKARLIDNAEITSEADTARGHSRGSYGLTELTGDMTVPEGKTTWGDGAGGRIGKEGSEEEGSVGAIDLEMIEEDSPYPEVRASVSNIDDPEMPAFTLRMLILGLFFVITGSSLNTFFLFRQPAPTISPLFIEIIVYPVGKAMASILPITTYTLPRWLGGKSFSFNPGPFNIKEHTMVVMMANVGVSPAYALHAVVSADLWYERHFGFGFSILFVLATQLTGFCLAGMSRRFVIWPASMIWPETLVAATNLNAFHAEDDGFGGGISRMKFLIICVAGAAAYAWLPGFLFMGLSWFSWVCWIAPQNKVVNQLFGVQSGLGLGGLAFDWSQIAWFANPLVIPWWAQANIGAAFVFFSLILVSIIYYTNTWYTAYLPINVSTAVDRFGTPYDIFAILGPDLTLNTTAYALYSPIYLSASFCMTYTLAFALTTALIMHTILWHGPRMYRGILNVKAEAPDIHFKLMKAYPEVPDYWYAGLFLLLFAISIIAIEVWHTSLPVWGYILALLLPIVYFLPTAFIFAMTSQLVAINLIAELVPGYALAGKPIAVMLCKVFTMQILAEGMAFVQDQKLGHYMKIPPRSTFTAQLIAAIVASFVQVGVKTLLFAKIPGMCDEDRADHLTCGITRTFFTSTVVWGLIGPGRLWSAGTIYYPQVFAALAGAIVPIPLFFYVRKYPKSWLRNWNLPVFLNGPLNVPPASGINYGSFLVTGFIFQFWIRRRNFAWWSKYNYILAAAMDVGTAIGVIILFLSISIPEVTLSWWGNNVFQETIDWKIAGSQRLSVPDDPGFFGPDTWVV